MQRKILKIKIKTPKVSTILQPIVIIDGVAAYVLSVT